MQDSIRVWLNGLSNKAEGTRTLYMAHFKRFVEYLGKTPDELRQLKWEETKSTKPWQQNQVENLVRQYVKRIEEEEGLSCNYARLSYASIRSFFKKNNLALNLDSNDTPASVGFGSAVPTHTQVKRIVNATGSLRYRSLFLFLKDSGLRLGDVLRLKWGDLEDLGEGYCSFEIITRKRKAPAKGFVGPETTEALAHYKRRRLKGTRKLPPERNIEENSLFCARGQPDKPLRVSAVSSSARKIMSGLGYDKISTHGLRKFWEQNMKADREAYLKQMIGRKLTGTERAYLQKQAVDLFEIYKENYDNLRVLEQPLIKQDEIEAIVERRVRERITELTEQLQDREKTITEITQKLSKVEELENRLADFQRTYMSSQQKEEFKAEIEKSRIWVNLLFEHMRSVNPELYEQWHTVMDEFAEFGMKHGWDEVKTKEEAIKKLESAKKKRN